MSGIAGPDGVAAAFAAALARREARRNVYRSYTEAERLQAVLEGRALERVSVFAPEFRDAASAGELWDDRILQAGKEPVRGRPEFRFLAGLAAAARDAGAAAATAAVRDARELDWRQQVAVYGTLRHWKGEPLAVKFGADRVVAAVLAEWDRLGLATQPPEDPQPRRRRDLTEAEALA